MARQQLSLAFSPPRLRELRERKGLLMQDLAAQAEIAASSLGKYEAGKRTPTAPNLRKLAEALEVGIDALLDQPGTTPLDQAAKS